MSGKKEFGREASGIATRSELEARIKARPKPKLERHLTITGTQERIVHGQVNAANENRIRIPKDAAARMKALSQRDGLTQAALVIEALGAYETLNGKL